MAVVNQVEFLLRLTLSVKAGNKIHPVFAIQGPVVRVIIGTRNLRW